MRTVIRYIADFLVDQKGSSSSKRLILIVAMFYLYMFVKGSLNGQPIDQNVLLAVVGIILFSIGAVTSEFFSNKFKTLDKEDKEASNDKKE